MTAGETVLEMEVRHVAEQEKRIARQEVLIERLRKVGVPLSDALRHLGSMQDLLKTMRAHLATLSNQDSTGVFDATALWAWAQYALGLPRREMDGDAAVVRNYRSRAEELRAIARGMMDAGSQRVLQSIAANYEKLARTLENARGTKNSN